MKLTRRFTLFLLGVTGFHIFLFLGSIQRQDWALGFTIFILGGFACYFYFRRPSIQKSLRLLLFCFALLAGSIYKSEPNHLGFIAFPDWLLLAILLYRIHFPLESQFFLSSFNKNTLKTAGITSLFFFLILSLFPKLTIPLFEQKVDYFSGYGDGLQINPGQVNELHPSPRVAFRARFIQKNPDVNQLYWRGATLTHTSDGLLWFRVNPKKIHEPSLDSGNSANPDLKYQILLEPNFGNTLFTLERTLRLELNLSQTSVQTIYNSDYTFSSVTPIQSITSYTALSTFERKNEQITPEEFQKLLLTPKLMDPRIVRLGRQLHDLGTSAKILNSLKDFFKTGFSYSLTPGALSKNSLAEFLFERKVGFCEHYAGSLATLLRLSGIPARVVIGFQGGEWNPISQTFTIRDGNAHAWVDAWLKDEMSWISLDPSKFLPLRPESNSNNQIGIVWNALRDQWAFFWFDALNLDILRWIVVILLTAVLTVYLLRKRNKLSNENNELLKTYDDFCILLKNRGFERMPHEGARAFMKRALLKLPQLQAPLVQFTELYLKARYSKEPHSKKIMLELKENLKTLQSQLR